MFSRSLKHCLHTFGSVVVEWCCLDVAVIFLVKKIPRLKCVCSDFTRT